MIGYGRQRAGRGRRRVGGRGEAQRPRRVLEVRQRQRSERGGGVRVFADARRRSQDTVRTELKGWEQPGRARASSVSNPAGGPFVPCSATGPEGVHDGLIFHRPSRRAASKAQAGHQVAPAWRARTGVSTSGPGVNRSCVRIGAAGGQARAQWARWRGRRRRAGWRAASDGVLEQHQRQRSGGAAAERRWSWRCWCCWRSSWAWSGCWSWAGVAPRRRPVRGDGSSLLPSRICRACLSGKRVPFRSLPKALWPARLRCSRPQSCLCARLPPATSLLSSSPRRPSSALLCVCAVEPPRTDQAPAALPPDRPAAP